MKIFATKETDRNPFKILNKIINIYSSTWHNGEDLVSAASHACYNAKPDVTCILYLMLRDAKDLHWEQGYMSMLSGQHLTVVSFCQISVSDSCLQKLTLGSLESAA